MARPYSILIIGGGSSGWMTATILNQRLPEAQITLVEASDIPIIGVGESTNPVIRYFNQIAGIDERAFMRGANAAYKIAIRFEQFNRLGGTFHHPFGQPAQLEPTLFKPHAEAYHGSFHLACQETAFSPECSYAYQVDAGLYGQFLKERVRPRGVRHVVDKVLGADRAENGDIACIRTAASGPLTADLYIDCSGFRSFLLDKTFNEPFHSVNKFLLNDRAIAARVPYIDRDRELKNYTNCSALSSGWVWQIPLWTRLGTGYVYSSAYLSPSEAEAEFRDFLGRDRVADLTFNHIDIRAGRHERAWIGNCVGIGVSYGFLEPLESTGLSLTQVALIDLARELSFGDTMEGRDRFNLRQAQMFDTTRDFILAHYVLTQRDDTPYWRHIREMQNLPESLLSVLEHAMRGSYEPIEELSNTFYDTLNWNVILSGMGLFGEAQASPAGVTPPAAHHLATFLQQQIHDDRADETPIELVAEPAAAHPMWFPTW